MISPLALMGLAPVDGLVSRLMAGSGAETALGYVISAVVALGALIFIHELGHFLVAKALGVGVERFSLGFGPRLWAFRRGETEYCVSVVPLGGYVKMMGEEAHGEDAIHPTVEAPPTDPRKSFSAKPLWARFLIVFAGPAMNFVLAAAIFSVVLAAVGSPVFPATVGRIVPGGAAAQAGLRPQDDVAAVDGQPVQSWNEIEDRIARSDGRAMSFTVVRQGERREVPVVPRKTPGRTNLGEPAEVWSVGTGPYVPPVVGDVAAGMPATEAGIQARDRIRAIDGQPVETWDDLAEAISKRPGEALTLTVERGGSRMDVSVTPRAVTEKDALGHETTVGRIGIARASTQTFRREDPASAVVKGVAKTWELTALTALSFWKLLTGAIPASNIGGPLQIGLVAGQAAQRSLVDYVGLIALLSINLAILNLLPVPMLDGGHLLFFVIEAVLGRPLSLRKREVAQQIGLALLLLLMIFALYNDVSKLPGLGRIFR
jgi:regulator of sigma E protease